MSIEVTVILSGYPTRALRDALTRPIREDDDQTLARVEASGVAGGRGVYLGLLFAARFEDVTMADLETFFRGIPADAYGLTQGIVVVAREQADPIVANRLGWMPPVTAPVAATPVPTP